MLGGVADEAETRDVYVWVFEREDGKAYEMRDGVMHEHASEAEAVADKPETDRDGHLYRLTIETRVDAASGASIDRIVSSTRLSKSL